MSKHPSEETLALYAGGDLGWWARWTAERHIAGCEACQAEVAAFRNCAAAMAELGDVPELNWSRIAAEMRANIRLGLDAGECVAAYDRQAPVPLFNGARVLAAATGLAALLATAFVLQRPAPRMAGVEGVVLEATGAGIERKEGFQALTLRHRSAEGITYTVGAQGLLRARYVDGDTGAVTINNVYAQ